MKFVIPEWLHAALNIFIFISAVGYLIYMVTTHIMIVNQVNQEINQKYSVYELNNDDGYVADSKGVPIASILYDISVLPDDVTIVISGYTVTAEDKENIKKYNDGSSILHHLTGHEKTKYKREYTLDTEGNIVSVSYNIS